MTKDAFGTYAVEYKNSIHEADECICAADWIGHYLDQLVASYRDTTNEAPNARGLVLFCLYQHQKYIERSTELS